MWVRTMDGELVNLDSVTNVSIQNAMPPHPKNRTWGISAWCIDAPSIDVAALPTKALAEAALDQLHEWLALRGYYELEGTCYPSSVFDFRKLDKGEKP